MATSTFAGSSFTFGKPFAWLCLHLLLRFSTSLPLSTSCFITFLCSSSHPLAAVFWFTCLVTLAPLRPVASLSWSGTILLAFASVFAFIPATFNSMAVLLPHVTPLGLDSVDYAFVTLRPSTPFLATHQRGVTAFIAHLVDRVGWFDGPGTTRTGHAAIEAPNRSKIGTVFNFYALPPKNYRELTKLKVLTLCNICSQARNFLCHHLSWKHSVSVCASRSYPSS